MARSRVFADPFGAYVDGYSKGERDELRLQKATRDMRDQDLVFEENRLSAPYRVDNTRTTAFDNRTKAAINFATAPTQVAQAGANLYGTRLQNEGRGLTNLYNRRTLDNRVRSLGMQTDKMGLDLDFMRETYGDRASAVGLANQQTTANIGATQAGVANTQSITARRQAMLPGELTQQTANIGATQAGVANTQSITTRRQAMLPGELAQQEANAALTQAQVAYRNNATAQTAFNLQQAQAKVDAVAAQQAAQRAAQAPAGATVGVPAPAMRPQMPTPTVSPDGTSALTPVTGTASVPVAQVPGAGYTLPQSIYPAPPSVNVTPRQAARGQGQLLQAQQQGRQQYRDTLAPLRPQSLSSESGSAGPTRMPIQSVVGTPPNTPRSPLPRNLDGLLPGQVPLLQPLPSPVAPSTQMQLSPVGAAPVQQVSPTSVGQPQNYGPAVTYMSDAALARAQANPQQAYQEALAGGMFAGTFEQFVLQLGGRVNGLRP